MIIKLSRTSSKYSLLYSELSSTEERSIHDAFFGAKRKVIIDERINQVELHKYIVAPKPSPDLS